MFGKKLKIRWTIVVIGTLLIVITGCSVASAAFNNNSEPIHRSAPHSVRSLPPAWTSTPETTLPKINLSPIQDPLITPTQTLETPLYMYQESTIIGYSIEGRPLRVVRFGSGPRDLMIVAGIHGGYEWNTIALAEELIAFLDQHPEIIHPRISIHILSSMNPDGAKLRGSPWGRGNTNNVDLNRNWDSSWSADIPKPNCWDIVPLTAGSHPGSEPETQALMRFIMDTDIEAMISYHSAGLGIFPGGNPPTEGSLSLAGAIASVSDYPYPPIDIGCEYTGTMTDWAADNGVPAIDVELSTHWDTDFQQNVIILQTFLDWRP